MTLFTSVREKRLWLFAFFVLVAIVSTLVINVPSGLLITDQGLIATLGKLAMLLIGATMCVHALKSQASKAEVAIWLGLVAVYLILFLRLGHPERTHLMEYSVLAIFIHKAFTERANQQNLILKPALLAILATLLIGTLDEVVQLLIPYRVFDPIDILFNALAALMTIGSSILLRWMRKKISKN